MNIAPSEPLSQVAFVHDYFQLMFQSETLSIYNKASVRSGTKIIVQGEPGFCDALASLIEEKAGQANAEPSFLLVLEFTSGTELRIHAADGTTRNNEAFSFHGRNGQLVVEQNE